ncbi:MAG: Ldh family oxidoreductase [Dehalococcoidia bacterium]|nr:Ldh family oxidoreductase [Dehalococcoidia bacterium]MDW8120441.1 Ldh family oxidoreductase [Chloroflexota bacterium]
MLEIFKVPERVAVRVRPEALRSTVEAIFRKMGVSEEDARIGADVLVTADLRGVDTHGVSNMLRIYVEGYAQGTLNPRPRWRIVRETPATANVDSDFGLGIMVVPQVMRIAIRKAKETGVGMITIHNGRHLGMAAYHAMLALPHDMIGICMTATGPTMPPTFGREARLGTNPIAIAAPARTEPPFVFDAAMTVIANNKLRLARRLGTLVPPGVLANERGEPIMHPTPVPDKYFILPLGSMRELGSHKGYSLACMVEILGGVLSGAGFGFKLGRGAANHFVAAINIDAFTPVERFKDEMDEFLRSLRETPPAPGHERVVYAGLPEWEEEQVRRVQGIPLHPEVIHWFRTICGELGIPYTLEG